MPLGTLNTSAHAGARILAVNGVLAQAGHSGGVVSDGTGSFTVDPSTSNPNP